MSFKPIDVRRKEFGNRLFGGYNRNEVDDFLDSVADSFEEIYTENVRMQEEVSSLRERLEQYEDLEDSIRSALVQAERAAEDLRCSASQEADNVRMNANREAELTVREAKTRSQQILSESSTRAEQVRESYEALKEARNQFAADFRKLLKGYLDVMDSAEVSSSREIEAALRGRLDLESMSVAREAAGEEGTGGTTQPFQWTSDEETSTEEPFGEDSPEVAEPEVEPSSAEHEPEQPTAADSEAEDEVDREEHSPVESSESERSESEESASSGEDERASRFLRRRE